ncbi:MAG: hypothetical protein K2H67_05205, partial [Treponemataceae bacterium]|nr:hypothetical protein [Treponemataceae bacterium]
MKKLSEQILKLGNEINVRAARGEKAMPYPVPESIPDVDDSEDFVTGLPEKPKTPEQIAQEEAEAAAKAEAERKASGEDDIFGSSGFGAGLGEMPDLSAFESSSKGKKKNSVPSAMSFLEEEEEPEAEPEPEKPKGIDGSGYSGFGFDDDGNLEDASSFGGAEKSAEPESTGFPELDELLNSDEADSDSAAQKSEPASEEALPAENASALDDLFDLGDFGDLGAFESPAENSALDESDVSENPAEENQNAPTASEEQFSAPAEDAASFDTLPDFEQNDALSLDGLDLGEDAAPENALSSETQA